MAKKQLNLAVGILLAATLGWACTAEPQVVSHCVNGACGDGTSEKSDDNAKDKETPKDTESAPEAPAPAPAEPAPAAPGVVAVGKQLAITGTVKFEKDSATILAASFTAIHELATILKDNPQLTKISVEGHTSDDGTTAHNQTLSQDRAKAVVARLVSTEGVDVSHLVAKGWGESKPIADNTTVEGREENRRVEFIVLEASAPVAATLVR